MKSLPFLLLTIFLSTRAQFFEPTDASHECHGGPDSTADTVHIQTFDQYPMKIVDKQKSILARWTEESDPKCQYNVKVLTSKRRGVLYIKEVIIGVGRHPNGRDFRVVWRLGQSLETFEERGHGASGPNKVPYKSHQELTLGIQELGVGEAKFFVARQDDVIVVRTFECEYGLNWIPDGYNSRLRMFQGLSYAGATNISGLCQNANFDPLDDTYTCSGNSPAIDASSYHPLFSLEYFANISSSCKV